MTLEQISGFTNRGMALAIGLVITANLIAGFSEAAAQIAPASVGIGDSRTRASL